MTGARLGLADDSQGLRWVEERSRTNLYACYQCGRCMAACPFGLAPQQVLRLLQLGQVERALAHPTTWECAGCLTCAWACPKRLSPARVHRTLRTLAAGSGGPDGRRRDQGWSHRLRTELFAGVNRLGRLGSVLSPWSSRLLGAPPARLAADWFLGIHRARRLPPFARPTFPAWFRQRQQSGDGRRGPVLLFHDTFMDYHYPATGQAATALLERAGFRVELAATVCCARPMLSLGLLDRAARHAVLNVHRLWEAARQGIPIVGCEPSCVLTLREEYPGLVPRELRERAQTVARQVFLIDEFLAPLAADGAPALAFRDPRASAPFVLYHPHCHQRALAEPARSVELLRRAGYAVEESGATCCGMAGAYGYEKEHYAASRAAGERILFPWIRARPEAQVAVTGASCRQQIEHFTGRRPRHVVEFLQEALA